MTSLHILETIPRALAGGEIDDAMRDIKKVIMKANSYRKSAKDKEKKAKSEQSISDKLQELKDMM